MALTLPEAQAWLYGLPSLAASPTPDASPLDRMRALLAALGNPEQRFKSIHVAGTKGKGSICAMLDSVLRASGQRVGLTTSPHLIDFRERIRIDGAVVATETAADLATRVQAAQQTAGIEILSFFEAVTAMAFLAFAEAGVDWAVVEVGLGGRLDPTNVISPRACVIASISLDHTAILGSTLAQIAAEKAGIIKTNTPVISLSQPLEVAQVIERIARERSAPLILLGNHWRGLSAESEVNRNPEARLAPPPGDQRRTQSFQVKQVSRIRSVEHPELSPFEGWYEIPLLGRHQIDNATAVLATLDALRLRGEPLAREAVREGLRRVMWPGRFDILRAEPPLIADGAHNVDSINKLAMTLAELYPGRRWTIIFGCFSDKDAEGMINALRLRAVRWIFVATDHPRARPPEMLAELARKRGARASVADSLTAAIDEVLRTGEPSVITGSVVLAGQAVVAAGRQL
ncbi:MAG: bifunctional folylpolyglutamate synthase/dihydrofolate synthase [Thermoflexales bacterium]|nr:bifunctional folylpolyglutamate synthase/dihydrofolate synthase [Thermoflexales bacterium]